MSDRDHGFEAYTEPTPEERAAEAAALIARLPIREGVFVAPATDLEVEPTSDILVRSESDSGAPGLMLRLSAGYGETSPAIVTEVNGVSRHLKRLTTEYGIQTAGVRAFIFYDADNLPWVGMAGDDIGGEAYTRAPAEPVPEHMRPAAERLLRRQSLYLFGQFRQGEPVLLDVFDPRQYRFKENTMILVDTGSRILERSTQDPDLALGEMRTWARSILNSRDFAHWEVAMETAIAVGSAAGPESMARLAEILPGPTEDL